MVVTKFLYFFQVYLAACGTICNKENITVSDEKPELITLQPNDFDNDLCILRFKSDDGDAITLVVDDISCNNQYHVNINGAVRPRYNNCKTTFNSKFNMLEVILTSRKTSLNLSQEGLLLSVSKQKASNTKELIELADISDTPSFSYRRGESKDPNDTKKDDDYIDWAVYVVVLVLIVLPIVAVLYCACKSTMPTSTSQTTNASSNARRTNETRLNQTAKTISQQPMNP